MSPVGQGSARLNQYRADNCSRTELLFAVSSLFNEEYLAQVFWAANTMHGWITAVRHRSIERGKEFLYKTATRTFALLSKEKTLVRNASHVTRERYGRNRASK